MCAVSALVCGYHSSDIYGYRSICGISSDGFDGGCGIGVLGAGSVKSKTYFLQVAFFLCLIRTLIKDWRMHGEGL